MSELELLQLLSEQNILILAHNADVLKNWIVLLKGINIIWLLIWFKIAWNISWQLKGMLRARWQK